MDKIMDEIYTKLATAEIQHEARQGRPLLDVLRETQEKYELMDLMGEDGIPKI